MGSKKFGMWCVVAAAVLLCLGLMAGTVSADPIPQPGTIVEPSPAPPTSPPLLTDAQLYQRYIARLLAVRTQIANVEAEIAMYNALLAMSPGDPTIQYMLSMLWCEMAMLQVELLEIRSVLVLISPSLN